MYWDVPEEVGRLLFSPSRLLLAVARSYGEEGDNVLRLRDASQGRELARLKDVGKVVSLAFVSDRELMAVAWDHPAAADVRQPRARRRGPGRRPVRRLLHRL